MGEQLATVGRKGVAVAVVVGAAFVLFKLVIGAIAAVAWFAIVIVAIAAIIWASRVL
ncbi:MAG: hypothetical protein ACR2HC_03385 [Thermoleophilaceae bacterium]